MSHFTAGPLEHLRKTRAAVFGFGKGRPAAERVEYSRGNLKTDIIAEPVALSEGIHGDIAYRAQGWVIDAASFPEELKEPKANDRISVGGEVWIVLAADMEKCFSRRSYGKDLLVYTKLLGGDK